MEWKKLATLKNSFDKRKELREFQKYLRESSAGIRIQGFNC